MPGLLNGDLQTGILDILHNALYRKDLHQSGFRVEPGADLFVGLVVLPGRSDHGIFERGDNHFGVDILFLADLFNGLSNDIGHMLKTSLAPRAGNVSIQFSNTRFAFSISATPISIFLPAPISRPTRPSKTPRSLPLKFR